MVTHSVSMETHWGGNGAVVSPPAPEKKLIFRSTSPNADKVTTTDHPRLHCRTSAPFFYSLTSVVTYINRAPPAISTQPKLSVDLLLRAIDRAPVSKQQWWPSSPYTRSPPPPATPAPVPSPPAAHGDKKLVVMRVEGQSCAHRGSQCLDGAAPLPGAKVSVTCRDRKNRVMAWRSPVADGNGYFRADFGVERARDYFMEDPREACFVRLLSSPDAKCNGITNINHGMEGAPLRDEGKRWTGQVGYENVVYAAGPLAFKPASCVPTRRY
ncbi:proline-rich protein 1-like [Phragmites australis]|uniref:proline-rich protein 1-like n=1 Tax=Phragmites australis TaxID=29695 RepID=UPI002D76FD28|nr:proline-rich protein 1-like [Phragmites australis]